VYCSDGTLLAARYHTAKTPELNLTKTATVVYRGSLPAATSLAGGVGNCKWSAGFTVPPRGFHHNTVGGGLGIRFREAPAAVSSAGVDLSGPAAAEKTVLFAVRNELMFTPDGKPLPKSKSWHGKGAGGAVSSAVIYRSTDSGRTFVILSSLSDATSETDLIFPTQVPGQVVLAVARYQTRHFADEGRDSGVLTNATSVTYKSTAVFRSTDGGKSWGPPGLVTGQGQQSGCFVELGDGSLVLPFGHKDAGEGQKFLISYDQGTSWSNSVYDLHRGGLYASSVPTRNGTEIITAYSCTSDAQSLCPE